MLQKLIEMFVGQKVSVTHSGDISTSIKNQTGFCVAVHKIRGDAENSFDIELDDQHRIGILIENITANSIEGGLGEIRGRRKIEIVS